MMATSRRPGHLTLRTRFVSVRLNYRVLVFSALTTAILFVLVVWAMTLGSFPIRFADVIRSVFGNGDPDIVMVLHDLTLAARYSDHLIAMKDGDVVAAGPPAEVITEDLPRNVFGIEATIMIEPATGIPLVLPEFALPEYSESEAVAGSYAPNVPDQLTALSTGEQRNCQRQRWLGTPFSKRNSPDRP